MQKNTVAARMTTMYKKNYSAMKVDVTAIINGYRRTNLRTIRFINVCVAQHMYTYY